MSNVTDRANLRRRATIGAAVLLVTAGLAVAGQSALGSGAAPSEPPPAADAPIVQAPAAGRPPGLPATGRDTFLMRLTTDSTSRTFTASLSRGMTAARSAARSELASVATAQQRVIAELPAQTPVLYRMHSVMDAVAVTTDVGNYAALKALPGVSGVYPVAPKYLDNSYAVPLQGAPPVWESLGDTGQGEKIAIIDSGIDYTHADFGGPGTVAAYTTAHASEGSPADPSLFPSVKVPGGYDFVGDAYTGSNTPKPDANPLDCLGHGSHVAGIAAGEGENASGTTYAGPYDTSTPFSTMRIGPGMAPNAKLYAYRVFGCAGSTNVIAEALDRASDPDGNGDPSDHADVANMSLGADYQSPVDGDSEATNAAVDMGMTVVVASGNGGDETDVGGSPGDAVKALTVANSMDASNRIGGLTVSIGGAAAQTFAASRSVAYSWTNSPDMSGPVVAAPTGDPTACSSASYPAGSLTGKVVLVDWDETGVVNHAPNQCGSATRVANVAGAGGIGVILANTHETFATGVTGATTIPSLAVSLSGGQAIRSALTASTPVTVLSTGAGTFDVRTPTDEDKVSPSSSRGIHAAGNVKPDVSAVGTTVFSVASGTGFEGANFTGTSMATPMVAGLVALVRQAHPAWTPGQVKADIVNTAGQDLSVNGSAASPSTLFAPARVGSGRIQAVPALANTVLASSADDTGTASVSFGPVEVTQPMTLDKHVTVQNTGASTVTYDTSYRAITTVPGVSYVISPAAVALAAGESKTVTVTFTVTDPSLLTKSVDPTIVPSDVTTLASGAKTRDSLAEASGLVLLTPQTGTAPTLRVPVYSAPRPTSVLTQPASLGLPAGDDATASLALSGTDVGDNGANGTGDAIAGNDIRSLAAGFELQATSGLTPACAGTPTDTDVCLRYPDERDADIKDVGVTSDYPAAPASATSQAYFAISTQGAWSTPSPRVTLYVYIDVNNDGVPDLYLYSARSGTGDVFVADLVKPNGQLVDAEPLDDRFGDTDAAVYDSDTMILPVLLSKLSAYGITAADPRISYGVVGFSNSSGQPIDVVGVDPVTGHLAQPMTADLFHPAIRVTDAAGNGPLVNDFTGTSLTVHRNLTTYTADHGLGLMMVHLHNAVGNKTQIVPLHGLTQAITFTSTATVPVQGTSYQVSANGGASNQPVVFTSATTPVCTVAGTTVSFAAAGTCTIDADQLGNADYDPAPTATQSITVVPVPTPTTPTTPTTPATPTTTATVPPPAPVAAESLPPLVGPLPLVNPTLTVRLSSARPRSRYGWYRTPVRLTFTCTVGSAMLTAPCPAAVTFPRGPRQTVSRTISAADGGRAAVTVSGLNIDTVKPTVKITGVTAGATYRGAVPNAHCAGSDALSGLASCTIAKRTKGHRIRFTARAADKAGNVRSVRVSVIRH